MRRIIFLFVSLLCMGYMYGQEKLLKFTDKGEYYTFNMRRNMIGFDYDGASVYSAYTIDIPKDGLWWFNYNYGAGFYYDNNEGILIRIIPENKSYDCLRYIDDYIPRDSTYVPTLADVERLFEMIDYYDNFFEYYEPDYLSQAELDNTPDCELIRTVPGWEDFVYMMEFMKRDVARQNRLRRHLIIETSNYLVVLFNIREENYEEYKRYADTFRLVEGDGVTW